MPLLACSISCFVDSSTVPVCLSMPLADVSESDVELKMPASDEAFARTSRRSSIESPSVEDRLAIKLPTWSVLM